MKRVRMLGMALLAVIAAGIVVASSASALLPTILYLPGGTGEALAKGSVSGVLGTVKLETAAAATLPGTGVTLELTALKNDTKLGTYLANFVGVEEEASKEKCTSPGFKAGEVHISGEWHLVFVGLSPATTLAVGLLFLLVKQPFECGKVKATTEGSVLSQLNKTPASGTDFTSLGGVLLCTAIAKQALTKYENEAGTSVSAELKANIGLGNEKACEGISKEVVLEFNKDISIDY